MKLRFRDNSLRFRLNRREVELLSAGRELAERLTFPGGSTLDYVLGSALDAACGAQFDGKAIRVTAPLDDWLRGPDIGFYFELEPALKVAIEKDLECVDGPVDEKDPHAYPRRTGACDAPV